MTKSPAPRLMVFTDLDATLLDETYSWAPAASALTRLKRGSHAVVLSSSKTLAEMRELSLELEFEAPLVAENGGTLAFPVGSSLLTAEEGNAVDGYVISTQGVDRRAILAFAHGLRDTHGYQFQGFADWDALEVSQRTGLDVKSASRALQRFGTEPIVWMDSEERWKDFSQALDANNILAVRGGRFIHLMGETDKARGLEEVVRRARTLAEWGEVTTVALGDSPNDLQMLSAADIAVVIPNSHHGERLVPSAGEVRYAKEFGPIGWNTMMHKLMDDLGIE